MSKLVVLVGSMSGTAEMVAEELVESEVIEGKSLSIELFDMKDVTADIFSEDATFLYCTSTYGTGEPPDNAKALFEQLTGERPDLSGVRYGLIGLGDKKYADTYSGGGRGFDQIMTDLGASRIGDLCELDASSGLYPEEVALEWFEQWVEAI